jgi:hypothetical protein
MLINPSKLPVGPAVKRRCMAWFFLRNDETFAVCALISLNLKQLSVTKFQSAGSELVSFVFCHC